MKSPTDVSAPAKARRDTRTREQLVGEIDRLRAGGYIEQFGSTARTFIRCALLAWVAYETKESISLLAGEQTSANIAVNFLSSISVNVGLAWGVAAASMGYGYHERKLRKRTVQSLAKRKGDLERLIDPRRSSSGLTTTGDTHPEDDAS